MFIKGRSTQIVSLLVIVAAAAIAQPAAADTTPYEAAVITPRAQVRSGPSERFYPTDTLERGDIVEVYREEAGGWLAIRPPEDSFSWVSGRHLKVRSDGLAEVARDGIDSRIGSRMSGKRNAAQVRLKKGEVVEVIDEEMAAGQRWYRIAPPAGEFRWIHATNVERAASHSESTAATSESPVVAASATNEVEKETISIPSDSSPLAQSVPAAGDSWRAPPLMNNNASTAPQVGSPPVATPQPIAVATTLPVPATQTPSAASISPTSASVAAASSPPPAAGLDPARQLADIELRLSRMASAPPQLWNTDRLERDAASLLSQAKTAAERDAITTTIAKIDRFKSLGRQYQQHGAGGSQGVVAGAADPSAGLAAGFAAGAGSADPRATLGSVTDAGRYDAVGILRPVVSRRPGAPQFALVDDRGQVISFVTPSPDVNLQPYLGHRVGITGNRGFIPEFNRAHVTAGRVTPLTQGLLR
jgi:uncharacterized protein YgiM (DUF1202 family)